MVAREVWIAGHQVQTIQKMWLTSQRVKELAEDLQKPWGQYPPLPEKKK